MKKFRFISTLFLAGTCSLILNAQPNAEQWEYFTHGMGSSVTLPVELIHFTATQETNNVILSWSTATETNNDFYTIQKSEDGINYITIAVVAGAGNSNELTNYQYADDASATSISYYRLMQTDYDGTCRNLAFTSCKINSSDNVKSVITYSNMENAIQLSVYSKEAQPVNIVLYDESGNEILVSEIEASKGMNQYSIGTSEISKGIYICRLTMNDKWYSEKIIVN
jgi:hypothetical protein